MSACCWLLPLRCGAQQLLRAPDDNQPVTILPSDTMVLEAPEERKDLPCSVIQHKPELGFDLRFHAGYEVSVPMRELSGDSNLLTIVFRVYAEGDKSHAVYFVQHFTVPALDDDAKGDAYLQGTLDTGVGDFHVDWLMRDRSERFCSSAWDMHADLAPKDKPIPLFIGLNEVGETPREPFEKTSFVRPELKDPEHLELKILVNFAPQTQGSAALQRTDVDALVTILKSIERDSNVGRISLVAFNMNETRVVYRQDLSEQIDFPALGKALQSMRLATVNLQNLNKNSETDFLENLIQAEVGSAHHPDAVIFAGPKAMLNADVPQEDLRRIGDIECPVFYLNYNLNPQVTPWKDSISHAIRVFRGVEYTISRPRDVWFSTTEVIGRIIRSKHSRAVANAKPTSRLPGAMLTQ